MEIITSKLIPLHGAASTMIGGRPENQDDMGWTDTPLGFLLVVCDGMGGGPGGKTASYIAKYVVTQTVMESPTQARREDVLKKAVSLANDALFKKMDEVMSLRGMGTTLVAILVNEESAVIAHLGDSRCYRMRGNRIIFRTRDHSLVGELVQHKTITEEQARVSPQSNVITRGLGNTNNHVAEIDEVPYCKGDRFVLCTDGVWGIMPQPDLLQRLGAPMDVGTVVNNLQTEVDRMGAIAGGGHDNHTLAILEMNADSRLKDKMSNTIKIILASLASLLLISLIFNIVSFSKLGKAPQSDEYNNLVAQVTRQQQELSEIMEVADGTAKEQIQKVMELTKQNGMLKDQIQSVQQQNDSLSAELRKALEASSARAAEKSGTLAKPTEQPANGQTLSKATPKELASLILAKLQEVDQVKEPTVEAAKKQLYAISDDVCNKLDQLGKACKNPQKTDAIKRIVPNREFVGTHIQNNPDGKTCSPTKTLKDEYMRCKGKIEDLQKILK